MSGDGESKFNAEDVRKAISIILAEGDKADKAIPNEEAALKVMFAAYSRLKDFGFKEACYCPKDGTVFDAIEAGSTGVHKCHYSGGWPKGMYWVHDAGDLWPSRPILFRLAKTKDSD